MRAWFLLLFVPLVPLSAGDVDCTLDRAAGYCIDLDATPTLSCTLTNGAYECSAEVAGSAQAMTRGPWPGELLIATSNIEIEVCDNAGCVQDQAPIQDACAWQALEHGCGVAFGAMATVDGTASGCITAYAVLDVRALVRAAGAPATIISARETWVDETTLC